MNIQLKDPITFLPRNKIYLRILMLVFIISFVSIKAKAQTNSLSFQNQTALEIVQNIESALEVKFNFIHTQLPQGKYSFSVSGDQQQILNQSFTVLDRNFEQIDENIFVINSTPIPDEKRIEVPVFSGKVNSSSGESLPYCSVIIEKLSLGFETDENGVFTFQKFVSDEEIILFKYIGYLEKRVPAKVLKQNPFIVLESEEHIMGEIIIKDFLRIHQSANLEDHQKINKEKVEVPGSGTKDIFLLAQTLPGINTSSESLNDLQIRGGPPDQTAYKWNGINLLQNSLFYGRISSVNPFMVDQIKISRNGASADGSSQASGSIELEANNSVQNKMQTYLYSDLLHFNIGLGIPIIENKLSLKTAYRQSHTQYLQSAIQKNIFEQLFVINKIRDDEYYTENFDSDLDSEFSELFKFNEWSVSMNFQPSEKTKFKIAATNFGNTFKYQFDQKFWHEVLIEDTLSLNTLGLSGTLEHKFNSSTKLTATGIKSKFSNLYTHNNDVRAETNPRYRTLKNEVDNKQIKLELNYNRKAIDLSFGIQKENWDVLFVDTTMIQGSGLFDINSRASSSENSAYVISRVNAIPKTRIEFGYRFSKYEWSFDDRYFIEPRMHISYLPSPEFKIHAHHGVYHQNLNRRDYSLPLDVERGIWFLSDERFNADNFIWVVRNRQTSIGAQYLKDNWKFSIDLFNKKISNLWTSALSFSVQEDPFKFSDLLAKGIEYATQYEQSNYKFLLTYEYTDEQLLVYENDERTTELKSPYSQKHRASMYHQLFKNNWSFGTMLKFASGRFYSQGESLLYDEGNNYYYITYPDGLLSEQAPYYLNMDASIFYHLNTPKKTSMKFGLHVINLLDRNNVIRRQSYIDYTKTPFELKSSDRPGIPFSWNISTEINF